MLTVRLPDGTEKDYPDNASALDVAESIGSRLANATVAAEVDGTIVDAMRPLADITDARPVPLKLLTDRDPEALGVLRHSCAHVMARAVMKLYPGVNLAFGPTLGNGFYYDFG
ncbi:MAG: TGS domain-containing protein, partial [Planctomycetes bacterium]|nr:TGS domain-containing protein [Planctomycetota bacterium]